MGLGDSSLGKSSSLGSSDWGDELGKGLSKLGSAFGKVDWGSALAKLGGAFGSTIGSADWDGALAKGAAFKGEWGSALSRIGRAFGGDDWGKDLGRDLRGGSWDTSMSPGWKEGKAIGLVGRGNRLKWLSKSKMGRGLRRRFAGGFTKFSSLGKGLSGNIGSLGKRLFQVGGRPAGHLGGSFSLGGLRGMGSGPLSSVVGDREKGGLSMPDTGVSQLGGMGDRLVGDFRERQDVYEAIERYVRARLKNDRSVYQRARGDLQRTLGRMRARRLIDYINQRRAIPRPAELDMGSAFVEMRHRQELHEAITGAQRALTGDEGYAGNFGDNWQEANSGEDWEDKFTDEDVMDPDDDETLFQNKDWGEQFMDPEDDETAFQDQEPSKSFMDTEDDGTVLQKEGWGKDAMDPDDDDETLFQNKDWGEQFMDPDDDPTVFRGERPKQFMDPEDDDTVFRHRDWGDVMDPDDDPTVFQNKDDEDVMDPEDDVTVFQPQERKELFIDPEDDRTAFQNEDMPAASADDDAKRVRPDDDIDSVTDIDDPKPQVE